MKIKMKYKKYNKFVAPVMDPVFNAYRKHKNDLKGQLLREKLKIRLNQKDFIQLSLDSFQKEEMNEKQK